MKKIKNGCTVIVNLGREEVDYLDRIGKDALFSTGTKLSRNKVISAMILAIKQLGIDGEGTKTKDILQAKIIKAAGAAAQDAHSPKKLLAKEQTQEKLAA